MPTFAYRRRPCSPVPVPIRAHDFSRKPAIFDAAHSAVAQSVAVRKPFS
ncbi:hypothetical protein AMIS_41020 [Actinoplanes missouriensis 431]|uniref:Uncharacterized protein n=1 Tax=Actinoplanes missouriensis (strain ATCC 14538 / DSM 43046 / CBS 188.64 / JCM 3121 / NBRC 102363 / NCIMB 12654 / NRRL B-3342 / UNCC 431) TaxID=512565 RepID=I0H8I5_ACTM4|nr:hypothetical protein AMIS_41020 [Actinoplanes missouriensis 431]